mmetsp:Transcript_6175/g.9979  ORF Transcript_6175/g.9979 Transcript_6175/m.9979 type:complete len:148 (+) Transcript_6175:368-811(+)
MQMIDKRELRNLSLGAEDTVSSEEEDDETMESEGPPPISKSLNRSIERLLMSSMKEGCSKKEDGARGEIIDEDGKIRFDRRVYDIQLYQSILQRVKGFDFDRIKNMKAPELQITKQEKPETAKPKKKGKKDEFTPFAERDKPPQTNA